MSSYAKDFVSFTDNWVDDNRYPPKGSGIKTQFDNSVLAITGASSHGFTFHSGSHDVQLKGYYTTDGEPRLVDASIQLVVPSWGEVNIMHKKTVSLSSPTKIPVNIHNINGHITLKCETDLSGPVVTMGYDIDSPYGRIQGHPALFSADVNQQLQAKQQGLVVLGESLVSQFHTTPTSPGQYVEGHWELSDLGVNREKAEVDLFAMFLDDFAVDKATILLPTYEIAVGEESTYAHDVDFAADKKQPFALEQSFFGIFGVSGTIEPEKLGVKVALYVSVPLAGRVNITTLEGSLLEGGVTAKIDVAVASGSAKLFVKNEGGKNVLYVNANVKVRLVGEKNIPDTRLVTLPF